MLTNASREEGALRPYGAMARSARGAVLETQQLRQSVAVREALVRSSRRRDGDHSTRANRRAYETTDPIWEQTGAKRQPHLAVGTGGTAAGTGQYLRSAARLAAHRGKKSWARRFTNVPHAAESEAPRSQGRQSRVTEPQGAMSTKLFRFRRRGAPVSVRHVEHEVCYGSSSGITSPARYASPPTGRGHTIVNGSRTAGNDRRAVSKRILRSKNMPVRVVQARATTANALLNLSVDADKSVARSTAILPALVKGSRYAVRVYGHRPPLPPSSATCATRRARLLRGSPVAQGAAHRDGALRMKYSPSNGPDTALYVSA